MTTDAGQNGRTASGDAEEMDLVAVNKVFHDHECAYYDERFAIVHDEASARRALAEVEGLLGRPLRSGEVVFDAGCGTGWLAAGLRRARPDVVVVGSDLSAGMLGKAQAAGAWPLIQADSTMLPLATGSVDVLVCRGVLHHLPEVPTALAEWRRVLKDDGAVVLSSEPTRTVEKHGEVLVKVLLALLRKPLTEVEDFWEVASMAANLHTFTVPQVEQLGRDAGFAHPTLRTADWLSTMVLTASYVTHGRRPSLARRLPWRQTEALAARFDALVVDRLLPARFRHTVVGRLEP